MSWKWKGNTRKPHFSAEKAGGTKLKHNICYSANSFQKGFFFNFPLTLSFASNGQIRWIFIFRLIRNLLLARLYWNFTLHGEWQHQTKICITFIFGVALNVLSIWCTHYLFMFFQIKHGVKLKIFFSPSWTRFFFQLALVLWFLKWKNK